MVLLFLCRVEITKSRHNWELTLENCLYLPEFLKGRYCLTMSYLLSATPYANFKSFKCQAHFSTLYIMDTNEKEIYLPERNEKEKYVKRLEEMVKIN